MASSSPLLQQLLGWKRPFSHVAKELKKHRTLSLLGLGTDTGKAMAIAGTWDELGTDTAVLIVADEHQMPIWQAQMQLCTDAQVHLLADPGADDAQLAWHRLQQLARQKGRHLFIIPQALMTRTYLDSSALTAQAMQVRTGSRYEWQRLFDQLRKLHYGITPHQQPGRGQARGSGSSVDVHEAATGTLLRLDFFGDELTDIWEIDTESGKPLRQRTDATIHAAKATGGTAHLLTALPQGALVAADELDLYEDDTPHRLLPAAVTANKGYLLDIASFPPEDGAYLHERYLSLLGFYSDRDWMNFISEQLVLGQHVVLLTKHPQLLATKLDHEEMTYHTSMAPWSRAEKGLLLLDARELHYMPHSLVNQDRGIVMLTDRELQPGDGNAAAGVLEEFIGSLKTGDYVVHTTHGIALFRGIITRTISEVTREYLHLAYAGDDALYVPIDQADRVNKYIGSENPKLTRLDSTEWKKANDKARKEAEAMAAELLGIYAQRELERTEAITPAGELMGAFDASFAHSMTEGQRQATAEVLRDLNDTKPMDRLLCGDVGFGKTEIAMRAAFAAFTGGRQVAVITPITILAAQHYENFAARMRPFGVRIEMLSRFRSPAEQKRILDQLQRGEIDIVVGTHRLLSPDVQFKDLGLLIVDEEQRFGVKQKELLKKKRANINVLTLTATPIPRTLNLALSKLREISLITTPPPGRLPVVTEVRKFSLPLIRQVIEQEVQRGGQVYFLHNRVQTIESIADKLRETVPNVRVLVAHGQLADDELEDRVTAFKRGEYDVLVSSTIIENGIDLPRANTLIVNDADEFGLSQLYQLRGRVGRGRLQAYSYMLYSKTKLSVEAKKRLRAIVEASELGAGFQIAMRDLEIRGAGEVLGSSQSGAMESVGMGHFLRLLSQAVADLKAGKAVRQDEEETPVTIELPISAFVPDEYIDLPQEKIRLYQKMAGVRTWQAWQTLHDETHDRYGPMPEPVRNLFAVLKLRLLAQRAGIAAVRLANTSHTTKQIVLMLTEKASMMALVQLVHTYPAWQLAADRIRIDFTELGLTWLPTLKKHMLQLLDADDMKEAAEYL